MVTSELTQNFSSTFPVMVYIRPHANPPADWQEFDKGPGFFHIPAGHETMVRIKNIHDAELRALVKELVDCPAITFLNLSENRNISGEGLEYLRVLVQLTGLNLSSCSLNDAAMSHLTTLTRLEHLDISFCNRLSDAGLKHLRSLPRLRFLDLQGCIKITTAGMARFGNRRLTIHR
jgi:hypothetical protein